MNSRVPISRLVSPSRTSAAILTSVAVRAAQPWSASRCGSLELRRMPSAQQFPDEERVARGQSQDPAEQRARPPAGLVEHQAFHHHRAHWR
jgi:hypothetical protein